jgi:hypothetical protein
MRENGVNGRPGLSNYPDGPVPSTELKKEPFSLRRANRRRHSCAYVSFTRALSEWWQIGHSKVRLLYSGLWGSLLASIIIAPHFGQDGLLVAIEAGLANRNPNMYFSLNEWNHRFANADGAPARCDGCGRPLCFVSVIP